MAFVRDYYTRVGYRTNLLFVGYRIAQDQNALLSYSHDAPVMTIDPVSTANPGWRTFLDAFNQFCSDRGGTPAVQPDLGSYRRDRAQGARRPSYDLQARRGRNSIPATGCLNAYFRDLLT